MVKARVAELVDALVSNTSEVTLVSVRSRSRVRILWFLLAISLPLSIEVFFFQDKMGLSVPVEPILCLLTIVTMCFAWKQRYRPSSALDLLILLYLTWFYISACFSLMPLVSLKVAFAKTWFILPAYFFPSLFHCTKDENKAWLKCFLFSLSLVVIYTLFRRYGNSDFDILKIYRTPQPFFNDHTQYGAVLALFLPVSIYFAVYAKKMSAKILYISLSLLLCAGLVGSACRAAWGSLFPALFIFGLVYFRIKGKRLWILCSILLVLGIALFYPLKNYIEERNPTKSSHAIENALSVLNFQNDPSSMERINRWKCAHKIAKEYPVFGSGAGTYPFIYAPYQDPVDRTVLSTDVGDNGNAHNEFLTALSETGIIGFIFFSVITFLALISANNAYKKGENPKERYFILAIFLGLLTYLVHSFYNNFLDTEKVAILFFFFLYLLNDGSREKGS